MGKQPWGPYHHPTNHRRKKKTVNDNVNHPSHYTQGPVHDRCGEVVECITVTEGMNFNVGNAVKYLWRADHKDNGQNAIQDLEKARWYITREIDRRKYEAARNEPVLPLDDATVTIDPDLSPFLKSLRDTLPPRVGTHAHEVDVCPPARRATSTGTHTGGFAFDVSPSFKALVEALFNEDEAGN